MEDAEIVFYLDSQKRIDQICLASQKLWEHNHAQKVASKNPDLRDLGVKLSVFEDKVVFAHQQMIVILFKPRNIR